MHDTVIMSEGWHLVSDISIRHGCWDSALTGDSVSRHRCLCAGRARDPWFLRRSARAEATMTVFERARCRWGH